MTNEPRRVASRKQRILDADLWLLRKSVERLIPEQYRRTYELDQCLDMLQSMMDNAVNHEERDATTQKG